MILSAGRTSKQGISRGGEWLRCRSSADLHGRDVTDSVVCCVSATNNNGGFYPTFSTVFEEIHGLQPYYGNIETIKVRPSQTTQYSSG